jgi:hypothetical protein
MSVAFAFFYNPPPAKAQPTFRERLTRFNTVFIRIIFVALFGFLAITYYLDLLYSRLPQALGGVRPRCAYLDVVKTDVSQDTLRALFPAEASVPVSSSSPGVAPSPGVANRSVIRDNETPKSETVRSVAVAILYSGSDYTILRVDGNVYELKKDVIRAIDYCK